MQLDLAVCTTLSLLMVLPHMGQQDTNCSSVSMEMGYKTEWILKSVGTQVSHLKLSALPQYLSSPLDSL